MEWYYAANGQTNGPVDLAMLRDLLRTGAINQESLVWNEELTDWTPLGDIPSITAEVASTPAPAPSINQPAAAIPAATAAPQVEMAICDFSRETLPKSEMLQFGDKLISPNHKDEFLQNLQQGEALDSQEFGDDDRTVDMRFGTILRQTWKIWRKNVGVILACQLVVWVPALFGTGLLARTLFPGSFLMELIPNLADLLFGIIATAAVYSIASQAWQGKKLGFGAAMGHGFRNYLRFFCTVLLRNIVLVIATLLFVIPGIFLAVKWVVALPAAFEDESIGSGSLEDSWHLTTGYFWQILWYQIVTCLIVFGIFLVVFVAIAIVPMMMMENDSIWDSWQFDALAELGLQVMASFVLVETYVLYRHLRDD